MKRVEKIVRRVIELFGILGVLFLAGMMLLVVVDVALRFLFDIPIYGSDEIIVALMVVVTFLGMGSTALRGEHISVDVLSNRLSKTGRIVLDVINYLVVLVYGTFVVTQSFSQVLLQQQLQTKSMSLGIPKYPLIFVVTFGTILLLLAVLILLYNVRKDSEVTSKELQ